MAKFPKNLQRFLDAPDFYVFMTMYPAVKYIPMMESAIKSALKLSKAKQQYVFSNVNFGVMVLNYIHTYKPDDDLTNRINIIEKLSALDDAILMPIICHTFKFFPYHQSYMIPYTTLLLGRNDKLLDKIYNKK